MILISNLASLATTPDTVTVAGYYAPGDGGGGDFTYDSASTLTPDGGIVFASSSGGNWIRIYSGPTNVRWFGAIMGAEISPGVFITDVTSYVHAARDSRYTRDGTLYFPADWQMVPDVNPPYALIQAPRPYVGAFEFFYANREINIVRDGKGSMLQSNGTYDGNGNPNPVVRLGWSSYNPFLNVHYMVTSRIFNVFIDGTFIDANGNKQRRFSDGIMFDDNTWPWNAGRWIMEKLIIGGCNKGIYKPKGNIGNTYINCNIQDNNIGYYALGYYAPGIAEMHAGCDKFIEGYILYNDLAGVYINAGGIEGYGQFIMDGTVIEGNEGFGIFIKMDGTSIHRMSVAAIELRDIWTERNATVPSVTIDGTSYSPRDFYFEQVRSVMITGSMIRNGLKAIGSSIKLINCRAGSSVEVDSESSVIADELRYTDSASDNIFVNSISYDGTSDIQGALNIPTSVWGPLRVIEQQGNKNILLSQHYDGDTYAFTNILGGDTVFTSKGHAGILSDGSAKLQFGTPGLGTTVRDNFNTFTIDLSVPKYYVWSIHAFRCDDGNPFDLFGAIGTSTGATTNIQLGQVILKPNTWVCSYGVKKIPVGSGIENIYLSFSSVGVATVLFADYQVLAFDNLYDAQSFLNSRAFATGSNPCLD